MVPANITVLPKRIWDLNPDALLRCGGGGDDILAHADAEWTQSRLAIRRLRDNAKLSDDDLGALRDAMARRHNAIWQSFARVF